MIIIIEIAIIDDVKIVSNNHLTGDGHPSSHSFWPENLLILDLFLLDYIKFFVFFYGIFQNLVAGMVVPFSWDI